MVDSIYDPTRQVGLLSLDVGSYFSPDGRDHPITALTPVAFDTFESPPSNPAQDPTSGPGGSTPAPASTGAVDTFKDWLWGTLVGPAEQAAKRAALRLGLGILALILLVVVAVRVTGVGKIEA